jgi:hypothetical protein
VTGQRGREAQHATPVSFPAFPPLSPLLRVRLSSVKLDSREVDEAVSAVAFHRHDRQIASKMPSIVTTDGEPIAQASQRSRAVEVRGAVDIIACDEVVKVIGLCGSEEIGPNLLHIRSTDPSSFIRDLDHLSRADESRGEERRGEETGESRM